MKTLSLTLVLSLIAVGTAGAIALPAALDATRSDVACSLPEQPVECVEQTLDCARNLVAGDPCPRSDALAADGGIVEYVECNVYGVREALKGRPAPYCYLDESGAAAAAASAGPDPKAVAECVAYFVEQSVSGRPYEPCAVGAASVAQDGNLVECVKSQVRQILSGVTPMPCDVEAANGQQLDPKKLVECTRYVVGQIVTGRPVLPCDVSFEVAAAGPDVGAVVDCTKKAVRDIVQGTPQPCPI